MQKFCLFTPSAPTTNTPSFSKISCTLLLGSVPGVLVFLVGIALIFTALIDGLTGVSTQIFTGDFWHWIGQLAIGTFRQALLSTGISAGLGLVLGLVLGPYAQSLRPLAYPFAIPSLVAVHAWLYWFGKDGLLGSLDFLYSWGFIIFAHSFFNIPWVALQVAQAYQRLPQERLEAVTLLGGNRWHRFRQGIWPEIRPAFFLSVFQVLSLCTTSFALVSLLGGGPPRSTLETEIMATTKGLYGSSALGSVLALLQFGFLFLGWCLCSWAAKVPIGFQRIQNKKTEPSQKTKTPWLLIGLSWIWVLPYVVILADLDLASFGDPSLLRPLLNSIGFALLCGSATLLMALSLIQVAQRWNWIAGVSQWLACISPISIALAMGVCFAGGSGNVAVHEWLPLLWTQALLHTPLAFRLLWELRGTEETRGLEQVRSLGANAWQAWRLVEWPKWRAKGSIAFATVVMVTLTEVSASSYLLSDADALLSTSIFRRMQQYQFAEAHSALVLLTGVSLILGLWIQRRANAPSR